MSLIPTMGLDVGFGGGTSSGNTSSTSSMNQQQYNWTPEQQSGQAQVGNVISQNLSGASPTYVNQYGTPGLGVAPMSTNEQAGQTALGRYAYGPAPSAMSYARAGGTAATLQNPNYAANLTNPSQEAGVYSNTMGRVGSDLAATERGDIIDPAATERLMAAIKAETMNDLGDLQTGTAKNTNLSGMYFSGGHAAMQGDLMSDAARNLMTTRANLLYSDEQAKRDLESAREARNYQTVADIIGAGQKQGYQDIEDFRNIDLTSKLEGAGLDLAAGNAADQAAINQISTAMEYGSLPREIEQAQNQAAFDEWMRTAQGNPEAINAMLEYLATQGYSSFSGQEDSSGSNDESTTNWNAGLGLL